MINVPTFTILDPYETYLGKIDNSVKDSVQIFAESFNTFLTGAAYTLSFKILKVREESALLVEGNKLAFIYKGKDYLVNIIRIEEDQSSKTVLAWADSLENTKEIVEAYAATKAMPISDYLDIFDHEKTITLGINEVADKSLKLEWEGEDKRLGRILSLATKFDAEAEFEVVLNNDYTTFQWVLNLYKKYEAGVSQGIGENRVDVKLRAGENVKTIRRVVDTSELFTAITPVGNNDLSISSIEYEEYDDEGRLKYFTEKGNRNILAPLARDKYPSNTLSKTSDRYQRTPWSYSTDSVDMLFGQGLARLKQISEPNIEYTIEGFFDLNLGDTVVIEDASYKPAIILTARVSEQQICWTNPANSQTTFSNFVEEESEIADNLLSRVEELIAANKTFTGSITSTNGIVFKNNTGSTQLTAVVRDAAVEVTDNFSVTWFKDGVELAQGKSITVTADDVVQKAVYGFEAKDSAGAVKSAYEVTVSDVNDGQNGRGVASTKVEYQTSTSGTTVPTGAWLTNPPSVAEGQYLWTRTTFTYTDNTTTLAYSVSRMGTTGTNGVGISDVTVTYQASASGTTPPTGSWTASIPSVAANQFLWTRTVTTYTDASNTTAYSVGKMGANGSDAQLLYLSASANVMSFDSNDIVTPNQTITLTAKLQNATGTIVWQAIPYIGNAAQTPITLAGTGNTRTLTSGNWTNAAWTSVAVTATLGSLTDTLSVVKVADGANAYVHTAWKMPDGTFTKVYPNDNLFSVDDWLTKPALSSNGVPYISIQGKPSTAYTLSTNIPRVTNFDVFFFKDSELVGSDVNGVDNNNPRTLTTSSTGNLKVAMRNFELSSGEYWIKLEEGSSATSNVFPKWEGSYSDSIETSSNNPADYEPWKIIKGQDGQSQKVHRGWKMPDGTFTKVYPLDNMLLNSKLLNMNSWGASGFTPTFSSEYVTLVKSVTTSGRAFFNQNINVSQLKQGQTYSISLMVNVKSASGANAGKSQVFLRTQTSSSYADSPAGDIDLTKLNQWQTINVSGKIMSGTITASQFTIAVSHDVIATIDVKKPKLVLGESALPWTPNPSEDPLNAYPSLEGMYADFNEEGSDNPDDYAPWTPIRGEDGTDAKEVFSGYLTNESIVLPANPSGVVSDFSKATGNFVTFLGQDQLSSGVAYSLESATGITTTINATTGAYTVTAISADIGVAIYKAVYNSITLRKQVMVVKAAQGASGVGLTSTVITYQVGTSGTTAPTGTWLANPPAVAAGQFLWTRTIWSFSDGTSKTGYSISKAGETGATGNGIASSAITYAASTSGTTVPSSGWQATIPTVAEGSFLWTRTIFTYTNGNTNTSYAVAKQGEKGDPTGILAQSTIPTAAQRYVGMLWKNTGAAGYITGATYRWNGSAFELYIFTAENMSVSNLAAISANLGTITAGDINGVTINGSKFLNNFSYTEGGVTYTGTTTVENGNIVIARTGSDGSTWTTKTDRALGFEDSYKASASAPARTSRLGQGQLYMVESGVGGYLPARALNTTSWTNLPLASGWATAENNPCQYRVFFQLDGSKLIRFRGQFTTTSGTMNAGSHRPFGVNSFPAEIQPNRTEFSWGLTNTRQGGRLSVTTTGDFQFQVDFACTYCAISSLSYIIE